MREGEGYKKKKLEEEKRRKKREKRGSRRERSQANGISNVKRFLIEAGGSFCIRKQELSLVGSEVQGRCLFCFSNKTNKQIQSTKNLPVFIETTKRKTKKKNEKQRKKRKQKTGKERKKTKRTNRIRQTEKKG